MVGRWREDNVIFRVSKQGQRRLFYKLKPISVCDTFSLFRLNPTES